MKIIPAIDLKDGKCVRLTKGDYNKIKVYYDDPIIPARKWKEAGAELIHIVDLDGAKDGIMRNIDVVKRIKREIEVDIEIGGGIRNIETVKHLLENNVDYVIIGTSAIENPDIIDKLQEFKEKISYSIDVNGDFIMTRGWMKNSEIRWQDFLKKIRDKGFNKIIVTDINKDGTLEGVNYGLYQNIADMFPEMEITVAGGVSTIDDIKRIVSLNIKSIYGIIIGKALYENRIDLKEAIEYVSKTNNSLS